MFCLQEEKQQNIKEEVQQSSNVVDFSSLENKLDALLKLNEKIYNADEKERQQLQKEKEEKQKQLQLQSEEQKKVEEEQQKQNSKELRTSELEKIAEQDYQSKVVSSLETVVKRLDTVIENQNNNLKLDFLFFGFLSALIIVLIFSSNTFKK
ncbi:hypothetical protein ACE5M2_19210 [Clostridioides difficile]